MNRSGDGWLFEMPPSRSPGRPRQSSRTGGQRPPEPEKLGKQPSEPLANESRPRAPLFRFPYQSMFSGQTINEVAKQDPGYLDFVAKSRQESHLPGFAEALLEYQRKQAQPEQPSERPLRHQPGYDPPDTTDERRQSFEDEVAHIGRGVELQGEASGRRHRRTRERIEALEHVVEENTTHVSRGIAKGFSQTEDDAQTTRNLVREAALLSIDNTRTESKVVKDAFNRELQASHSRLHQDIQGVGEQVQTLTSLQTSVITGITETRSDISEAAIITNNQLSSISDNVYHVRNYIQATGRNHEQIQANFKNLQKTGRGVMKSVRDGFAKAQRSSSTRHAELRRDLDTKFGVSASQAETNHQQTTTGLQEITKLLLKLYDRHVETGTEQSQSAQHLITSMSELTVQQSAMSSKLNETWTTISSLQQLLESNNEQSSNINDGHLANIQCIVDQQAQVAALESDLASARERYDRALVAQHIAESTQTDLSKRIGLKSAEIHTLEQQQTFLVAEHAIQVQILQTSIANLQEKLRSTEHARDTERKDADAILTAQIQAADVEKRMAVAHATRGLQHQKQKHIPRVDSDAVDLAVKSLVNSLLSDSAHAASLSVRKSRLESRNLYLEHDRNGLLDRHSSYNDAFLEIESNIQVAIQDTQSEDARANLEEVLHQCKQARVRSVGEEEDRDESSATEHEHSEEGGVSEDWVADN